MSIRNGLPTNLYQSAGYYKYRHPLTRKCYGMGKDEKAAVLAAEKLNLILKPELDLVQRVLSDKADYFGHMLDRYVTEYLPTKKLKPKTLAVTQYNLNRLEADLSKTKLSTLSVRFLSDYLDKGFKNNAYIKMRGLLVDIYRFGISKGLADNNLPALTLAKTPDDKQRQPLTLDWYNAIYALAPQWLQIAMQFALVTLQRRSDICAVQYEHIRDGHLHVIQQKTEKFGHRAFLRIEIGESLQAIINRSRQSGIASPYIIHTRPERLYHSKDKQHWSQIRPEHLSKMFKLTRDKVPLIKLLPPRQRPTFHEIRALGGWLYLEAGFPELYVQTLMGHATPCMTAHYTDRHQEWTSCKAELLLNTKKHI